MAIKTKVKPTKNAYANAAAFDNGKKQEKEKKITKRPLVKIVLFNVVNVALVAATIYFLGQLPKISSEIEKMRSEQLAAQENSDAAVLSADIKKNTDKIDSLNSVLMDTDGFKQFLDLTASIKGEGVLTEVSFPGGKPVENKAKVLGLPVLMVFQGSLDQVNNAMQRIYALPFIVEPVNLEVEGNRDSMTLRYGGFIRTQDTFAKTQ